MGVCNTSEAEVGTAGSTLTWTLTIPVTTVVSGPAFHAYTSIAVLKVLRVGYAAEAVSVVWASTADTFRVTGTTEY